MANIRGVPYASISKVRSKIELSEGQKRRRVREAQELLHAIENDLDPDSFTIEEICEEGVCGYSDPTDPEQQKHLKRCLNILVESEVVEIEEDGVTYRLNRLKLSAPQALEGFAWFWK